MTSTVVCWPALPVKTIIPVKGKYEYYIKAKDTSEQLTMFPPQKDGFLEYQFFKNKAGKLVGYRFCFDPFSSVEENLPRVTVFSFSVFATYIPVDKTELSAQGEFFVLYHDLNVRVLRYSVPDVGITYSILMRSKRSRL